jgi:hypothetical protein
MLKDKTDTTTTTVILTKKKKTTTMTMTTLIPKKQYKDALQTVSLVAAAALPFEKPETSHLRLHPPLQVNRI